ncbi:testis expressed 54 [Rhinolophus ferrumequinum]|uniref:Testis expressed 54 n=1 Tax=Rhinolophus ferrumequinum TaxID=59479 RepID=A0A7J7WAP7_RHIFE|nr:testis-expressed protein 54 [Rhinolophus ferrumequinum]KAF6334462.1 testis expressed 54 [Rhinolophus ferrumequinum]
MGCCQDKDFQTSKGHAKEAQSEEVEEEDTEGIDVDSSDHQNPKRNKSLLITVLWRRLSMFSRRGSTRSNRRQSIQNQKHGCMLQNNAEKVLEEPEKG